MNQDPNKYAEDFNRFQKRQKIADDEPHAYAAADENSSDSDDEVKSAMINMLKSVNRALQVAAYIFFLELLSSACF